LEDSAKRNSFVHMNGNIYIKLTWGRRCDPEPPALPEQNVLKGFGLR